MAETGFLITRSSGKSTQYEKHRFDLKAYLAAFPMLFETIHSFLSQPPSAAAHRLQSHCVSCDWYIVCYHNALENEDIQFLPGLTLGELLKLRKMGCATIAQTHAVLEKVSSDIKKNHRAEDLEGVETGFILEQKKQVLGRCAAFLKNQIFLVKKNTRLFPSNISQVFFIHLRKDPLTGLPCALGLQVMDMIDPLGTPIEPHVWIMENDQERRQAWQEFIDLISNLWEKSISNGKGPHIFHFGSGTRLDLLQWRDAEQGKKPRFLWQTQPSPWTDLRKVFKSHFYMPAPGIVSLFALGHVFGCNAGVDHPETLFHHHGADGLKLSGLKSMVESSLSGLKLSGLKSMVESSLSIMVELYAKACSYLESQWIQEWDANLQDISLQKNARVLSYLRFIKEEQRLQEDNTLALQELTLRERMLRFRAIGYLSFVYT
ncbi:MAG: Lhr-like helicase, partial [Deltaproteobacteria bacterium]|nr:Lhr-like helicase [Deltaproteobacteria bacterium]